jgi:DNA-binding SARP family transcriptional activator
MATVATAQGGIRLRLLGEPKLDLGTDAFSLERKDAALLALLAIDGATARGKAAALLWPDVDDDAARNNLRQRLHRLRRRAGRDVALTTADVLRLADGVSHDLSGAAELLAQDAGTVTGELLGSLDYADCEQLDEWLQAAREQWRATRRNALAEIASKLEREGHIALALQYGERLLGDDPLREHTHRQLMRLHYLRGDRAAALAGFERCRELLKRELGTTPGNETIELAALIESSGVLSSPAMVSRPVSVLRPPKLVGRDTEWSELEIAWQHGRLALVCGEPGIGKTRLLGDFVARHDGAIVIGARPGDERVPFALLARLLRAVTQRFTSILEDWTKAELSRLLPELGAAPESKLQPLRLQRAVSQALLMASKAGLTACAIDDLHFADDASVESLLALTAEEKHVRWLVGVRTAEMPRRLLEWLERTESNEVARIELAPLDVSAIETLLVSLALPDFDAHAWAESLARHTGGNPLFILETLSAVLAQDATALRGGVALLPAPGSIGQLIERRLHKLSRDALRLARVAALAGQDFSVELAARVLGAHPLDLAEGWHELEVAQIIRADREGSAFAHDLILDATLRSVPGAIATVMHRGIAAELQSRGAPAARVALHWYDAKNWMEAGTAFVAAANDARRSSQRAAEAEHWQRAADCFDRAEAAEQAFNARFESIDAVLLIHGVERATEVVNGLLREAKSTQQRVNALTAQANTRLLAADHAMGIAAAREAHELAQQLDSPWPRFEAARLLAVGLSQSERASEALPLLEPFRELIEREGPVEQRMKFWSDYAYVLNSARRLRRTADALVRAIEAARMAGDFGEQATLTSNYANTLGNLGRVPEALEQAQRARALQMQLGETGGPAGGAIDMYIGMHNGTLGRYRDALASLDAALECFVRDGQVVWIAVANNHRATMLLELGQVGRAQKALEYALPQIESVQARREILAGRIERLQGHNGVSQIDGALKLLGDAGDPYIRMLAQLDHALTLPSEHAVACCEAVQRTAEELEYLGIAAKARFARARHLLRQLETHKAVSVLRELPHHLRGVLPVDMYRAEAWWIEFEVFSASGDLVDATTSLARAVDWINTVALPNVPDEFSDSFLNRNPINRAILTTATRRLQH